MSEKDINRRDFLKLGGLALGTILLEACGRGVIDIISKTNTPNPNIPPGSTETAENPIQFVGSIEAIADFDKAKFVQEVGINMQAETVAPFRVVVEGSDFDFVALPPTVDSESKQPLSDERLFLQTDTGWIELVKSLSPDEKSIVWLNQPDKSLGQSGEVETQPLEAVLWYPRLESDWEAMKEMGVYFSPPSTMEKKIPGYSRIFGGIFLPRTNVPETVNKALFSLTPVEARSEKYENIDLFIRGEGKYADEVLKDIIFQSQLSGMNGVESDLGLLSKYDKAATAQGIVLGSEVKEDGSLVVYYGTKNLNGDRVVLLLRNTPKYYRLIGETMVSFLNKRVNSWGEDNHDRNEDILTTNMEDLQKIISTKVGEPMLLSFSTKEVAPDYFTVFKENLLKSGRTEEDYILAVNMVKNEWVIANLLVGYLNKTYEDWNIFNEDTGDSLSVISSADEISTVDVDKAKSMGMVVFLSNK